ncbi:MAG: universal stress protein [Herminiimonas sp.]|nr:universal stress protein [Herminiimonas sp.]
MFYKTILVQVYDSKHLDARVEAAANIAVRENAHLIAAGLTGVTKFIRETFAIAPDAPAAIDLSPDIKMLRERAHGALRQAEDLATRFGVKSFEKVLIDDEAVHALIFLARYCDLIVLAQPDPDEDASMVDPDSHEHIATGCSEPALIMPYTAAYGNAGEQVLIAWNASQQAKRAVHNALPLLQRAKRVEAVIFNPAPDPGNIYGTPPGDKLKTYLARHNVDIKVMTPTIGDDIDDALLSLAVDGGFDLIVMGCYSHSRFRELILGGTTRAVFKSMTVPVLMSH